MTTKINTYPYFDDFDPAKNFHQVLFRPEFAVQARELSTLQSILKNQIALFGNHMFKHGSLVIPGASKADLAVPYVRVESTYSGVEISTSYFASATVIGQTTGVRAIVNTIVPATATDPITFYLSYVSGGYTLSGVDKIPNGKLVFEAGEELLVENAATTSGSIIAKIAANTIDIAAVGYGTMAHVNSGVYYINGTFVSNAEQSVVMSKYTTVPSCHVMFKITESIVNHTDDESLLDPAQGSPNFTAPGADRLKISLELLTLPIGSVISDDYVELMRYVDGELQEHNNSPRYNELEKALAQRTFDESGNYIVNGLSIGVREHKRDLINNGLYSDGDYGKFSYEVSKGKAYFKGLAIETLGTKRAIVDKARTVSHVLQGKSTLKPEWGQYILVSAPQGSVNISARETVNFYSTVANTVSVGSAKVIGFDYLIGSGAANSIYKLYISDLTLTTSTSYDKLMRVETSGSTPFIAKVVSELVAPVNGIAYANSEIVNFNSTIRTGTVSFFDSLTGTLYVHKHNATVDVPRAGDLIVGATSTASSVIQTKRIVFTGATSCLLFPLPNVATKSLKNSLNNYDMEYTAWVKLSIASGSTTASIASGQLVPIEAGTFIALTATGLDSSGLYSINVAGNTITRSSATASVTSIYCQVRYTNASPRTKTITQHSGTYTSANKTMLTHADVYSIVSIIHNGVDITSRYTLDSGQNEYEYGLSSVVLKRGFTLPAGNLSITYKYFAHSAGDFFSVDSYSMDNDLIPSFKASNDKVYQLRDCIDFRKNSSMNSNVVVPDTFVTTSVQSYIPRIDVVCIDRQGNVSVVNGTPAVNPKTPTIPTTLYPISRFYVPAYTYRLSDIKQKEIAVVRYTMEGVDTLKKRVEAIEQYSQLTAVETEVTNTPFIDASTGLDRFKTGYLVESMTDPFTVADAYTENFKASITPNVGISAMSEEDMIYMTLNDTGSGRVIDPVALGNTLISETSTSYVGASYFVTGGIVTLPYYDTVFAKVDVSSRITNVNPFNVVKWNGTLSLVPNSDIWVDVVTLPDIINNETVTINTGGGVVSNIIWLPATPAPAAPVLVPVVQPPTEQIPTVVVPVGPIAPEPVSSPVNEVHMTEGLTWDSSGILDGGSSTSNVGWWNDTWF